MENFIENFTVSGIPDGAHEALIRAYAVVKRACAIANAELGLIDTRKAEAIEQACEEIEHGALADQFQNFNANQHITFTSSKPIYDFYVAGPYQTAEQVESMEPTPRMRVEHDCIGALEVPQDVYWGIHTQRAIENFTVSGIGAGPIRRAGPVRRRSRACTPRGRCRSSIANG